VELREVASSDKAAALTAASPRSTVPVLQVPDGTVLEERIDIMRRALNIYDPEGWLRIEEADEVQAWVQLNDCLAHVQRELSRGELR
jgi:glutathione S-transferase